MDIWESAFQQREHKGPKEGYAWSVEGESGGHEQGLEGG